MKEAGSQLGVPFNERRVAGELTSAGLAMVAEHEMNCTSLLPTAAQIRLSLRAREAKISVAASLLPRSRATASSRLDNSPTHDKGDMTPEEPGVGVQLVHDYELEMAEEGAPRLLAREDGQVQHVGVSEDLR